MSLYGDSYMIAKNRYVLLAMVILAIITGFLFWLFANRYLQINTPSEKDYPVRGVDISSYQGEIDWDTLSNQNIDFAFIKTTEGSSFVDKYYASNREQALKTRLRIGFYHFFSYDSIGENQANHFINTVEKHPGMLPPVVDVELYGDYLNSPKGKDKVLPELQNMLEILEVHYGVKPIIYATGKSYNLYISGSFPEYDIWIRDVYFKPNLSDGREWVYWQYSDTAR
jgi:lysozyme